MKTLSRSPRLALTLSLLALPASAQQKLATLTVTLDRPTSGLDVPASFNLDELTKLDAPGLSLVEVSGKTKTPIAFQVDKGGKTRMIYWMVNHTSDGAKSRTYELAAAKTAAAQGGVAITDKDESLVFAAGGTDLLSFKYGVQKMPANFVERPNGKAINYARGGFIHPLKSPTGQVLTRINAPDHWHHYGIWNPWTHAHVNGNPEIVDFWNIGDGKATVRLDKTKDVLSGPVFAEAKADLSALQLNPDRSIKVDALGETQTMRVYQPQGKQSYIFDFTSVLSPRVPFTIVAYRYAGFGWRATPEWNATNSEMITSEGIDVRSKINGTRARWCIVQGMTGGEYAGAVVLSNPENHSHPEAMRVWDEKNTNARDSGPGAVFFNFNPAMEEITPDWPLEVGKSYELKYRMIVYTGKFTPAMAESAWQYYAKPATVVAKK